MKKVKLQDVQRNWHLFDAKTMTLGRLASNVAEILMGKNKSYYTPYMDAGDFVVVVNAREVKLSGKKETQKNYYRHSGFPGGLYIKTAAQMREKKPQEIVRHAVVGMLPKTKLGKIMLKKLFIYEDREHPYKDKFK
jgi:large subunit ribosomal protein L13